MTTLEKEDFQRRLGYILHCGLVEIRSMAHDQGRMDEIQELADLLEFLPRYLVNPSEEDRSLLCTVIGEFQKHRPLQRELAKYLHDEGVPEAF